MALHLTLLSSSLLKQWLSPWRFGSCNNLLQYEYLKKKKKITRQKLCISRKYLSLPYFILEKLLANGCSYAGIAFIQT